ncbi:MAG: Gfo/Idh/MocA family oxidoreductase [Phycisphaerae bacterium]|nr:Gfo/Idh/MocA family oxidoreductase [Phycisphaerae bacterium]
METLKVGFIGSGFIARFLATAFQHVRGIELVGVLKRSTSEDISAFARQIGVGECKVYSTIKELCQNCDTVAILSPNYARLETVQEIVDIVKSGVELKGLICEKPLGRTVAEATKLVELAEEIQLPTAYMENQIHMKVVKNAIIQTARVQELMGPLTMVRSSEEHAGPHNPWFWDPTKQGGGALSDLACHSIAVSWFMLTPTGKPLDYLKPVSVNAETALLKWGSGIYRDQLREKMGIDYAKTPAEDFATGMVTFKNPETGFLSKAQFTNSWMYDKQGLRILMEALGPGYAFEINSLKSPLEVFIADSAADALADAETALEKATSSRGLIPVQPNEADLFGYTDEFVEVRDAFLAGRDALLNWRYGLEITKLCQAAYMSAERRCTIDLTDVNIQKELESYTSLIAQGRGAEVLY